MDFPGIWQHFPCRCRNLSCPVLKIWIRRFDGSSIRGWQPINASDMLVIPMPLVAKLIRFMNSPPWCSSETLWIPLPGKHTP
ncbi:MAG: glutamine synthetase beta-grasp domain-containing protein [Desulfobacterales bacterium]